MNFIIFIFLFYQFSLIVGIKISDKKSYNEYTKLVQCKVCEEMFGYNFNYDEYLKNDNNIKYLNEFFKDSPLDRVHYLGKDNMEFITKEISMQYFFKGNDLQIDNAIIDNCKPKSDDKKCRQYKLTSCAKILSFEDSVCLGDNFGEEKSANLSKEQIQGERLQIRDNNTSNRARNAEVEINNIQVTEKTEPTKAENSLDNGNLNELYINLKRKLAESNKSNNQVNNEKTNNRDLLNEKPTNNILRNKIIKNPFAFPNLINTNNNNLTIKPNPNNANSRKQQQSNMENILLNNLMNLKQNSENIPKTIQSNNISNPQRQTSNPNLLLNQLLGLTSNNGSNLFNQNGHYQANSPQNISLLELTPEYMSKNPPFNVKSTWEPPKPVLLQGFERNMGDQLKDISDLTT